MLRAQDIQTIPLRYPTRAAIQTRIRKNQYLDAKEMIDQLARVYPRPVDLIAHSFGGLLGCRMMELGGTNMFRNVFFFAPAIDNDWVFPLEAFRRLYVIHNPNDRALWFAKILFRFEHPWGDMGRVGYQGEPDMRIENIQDKTKWVDHLGRCHSHYFGGEHLNRWTSFVLDKRKEPVATRVAPCAVPPARYPPTDAGGALFNAPLH